MKINIKTLLLTTLAVLAVIFIINSVIDFYRMRNPYSRVDISNPISVDENWKQINLAEHFKPYKKKQEICVEFSEAVLKEPYVWKPKLKNGVFVTLEVQVIDERGNTFDFNKVGSLSEKQMCFIATNGDGWDDILPKDRNYESVKVRSDYPINLSKVEWYGYNPQDRK